MPETQTQPRPSIRRLEIKESPKPDKKILSTSEGKWTFSPRARYVIFELDRSHIHESIMVFLVIHTEGVDETLVLNPGMNRFEIGFTQIPLEETRFPDIALRLSALKGSVSIEVKWFESSTPHV